MFQIWDGTSKDDVCVAVGSAVTSGCEGIKNCDSCAIAMAQIYQSYEKFLNDLYAGFFQEYEEKMFNTLEIENKKV